MNENYIKIEDAFVKKLSTEIKEKDDTNSLKDKRDY